MLPDSEKEDKAVMALIVGTLRSYFGEVTEEEIESTLRGGGRLNADGQTALDKLGNDPFANVGIGSNPVRIVQDRGELAAMHRDGVGNELDTETSAELEARRQEALRRFRDRRNGDPE